MLKKYFLNLNETLQSNFTAVPVTIREDDKV